MARWVPDALSTAVFMLVVLVLAALALGNTLSATLDAWYRGLWMLLPFTMQVTLVLLLGTVLASTPLFRRLILAISARPRTVTQVIVYAVLVVAAISYVNWGLALALGPLIAVHFAAQAERKGLPIDFPFLLATLGAAGSVWQFGLSASGPLLMATENHFLQETAGVMPLRSTIWSPAAVTLVVVFPLLVMLVARRLMPRTPQTLSQFPNARMLVEPVREDNEAEGKGSEPAQRIERHRIVPAILCAALLAWLYHHFFVKRASLDLNSLNTIFLLLCLALHGNIRDFSQALKRSVVACWPILVLYHVYAGLAGIIQFTSTGSALTEALAPASNRWTFPLLTAIAGTLVAIIVPSSGGQWVIQGFVTINAAEAAGVTAQRGMLALGVGDQMGNLVSPFWFVIRAEIARMDFRTFFGYGLIFAGLWFVTGVLVFTLLPA
jgi:short-chain fatty acids transporter